MAYYTPTAYDIQWTRGQLRRLNEGGILHFKDANLRFKVEHLKHCLTLMNPVQLLEAHSQRTYEQTVEVCRVLGYAVVKAELPNKVVELRRPAELKITGNNPREGYVHGRNAQNG